MRSFEARWAAGVERFLDRHQNHHTHARNAERRRANRNGGQRRGRHTTGWTAEENMRALNMVILQRAFATSTFIYGTTGPTPLQNKRFGSGPVAVTLKHLFRPEKTAPTGNLVVDAQRILKRFMLFVKRVRTTYDPGPRVNDYLRQGHQMMDMYFGMQGVTANMFWQHRNSVIAEFVHYVMDYHVTSARRTGIDFDPGMAGWEAYQRHFNTTEKGWVGNRYGPGQTATKEISKIIRHGIKTFGGKLIFEGRQMYGHNVFSRDGQPRDTDAEARDLFQYFGTGAVSAVVPMERGTLEFQWDGQPTVPSRAHFLSNWQWRGDHTHTNENRVFEWYSDFLQIAMQRGRRDEFMPIWDRFPNFPPHLNNLRGPFGMMQAIEAVS